MQTSYSSLFEYGFESSLVSVKTEENEIQNTVVKSEKLVDETTDC